MSRVAFYYRPDIDGLRAVAVVAVVLFHSFPRSLPGGFVGVDLFFLALFSFSVNVVLVDRSPSLDFYFPTSRIWELLIGSALASVTLQSEELPSPTVSNCLAVLGSLLIGSSLLLLNERRMFPGWWALLPTGVSHQRWASGVD